MLRTAEEGEQSVSRRKKNDVGDERTNDLPPYERTPPSAPPPFTCVRPVGHAGVDGALEVSQSCPDPRVGRDAMPLGARLPSQASRLHTDQKQGPPGRTSNQASHCEGKVHPKE